MRRIAILATVVVAALSVVGAAQAGVSDGLGPWADYVVANNQGCAYIPPDMTHVQAGPRPSGATRRRRSARPRSPHAGRQQPDPGRDVLQPRLHARPRRARRSSRSGSTTRSATSRARTSRSTCSRSRRSRTRPRWCSVYVSADNVNYFFAGTVTKDGTVALPAQRPGRATSSSSSTRRTRRASRGRRPTPTATTSTASGRSAPRRATSCTGKIEICKALDERHVGQVVPVLAQRRRAVHGQGRPLLRPDHDARQARTASSSSRRTRRPTSRTCTTRPSNRLLIKDLPNRTAIVFVAPGSTAANETMVTFTNQPAGGTFGDLKICKLTESPQYIGPAVQLPRQRRAAVQHRGQRRVRRSVDLVVPPRRHVPGRHEGDRLRGDPGGRRGRLVRLRPG